MDPTKLQVIKDPRNAWIIRFNLIRYKLRRLCPRLIIRPMIDFVKRRFNYPLIGVEIGVFNGDNSKNILHMLPMKLLMGIDPVKLHNIKNHKFIFLQKTSDEAVDDVPNNLDFVYIDGDHSYETIKKDIKNYYPKVKKGGVIGGHDFSSCLSGVPKAVLEFVDREHLELEGFNYDWWVVKK